MHFLKYYETIKSTLSSVIHSLWCRKMCSKIRHKHLSKAKTLQKLLKKGAFQRDISRHLIYLKWNLCMFFFPFMKQTFNVDLLSFIIQPLLLFLAKMFCKNSVMSQREHISHSLFGLYLVYVFFFSFQQSFLTKLKGSVILFFLKGG